MSEISVLILTYNEELHIERCIRSLLPFAKEIFIVDSFSEDNTVKLARNLGAKVYEHSWVNYAQQYQWGLDNCPIKTDWVMRMDADEYVLPGLALEIKERMLNLDSKVSGIYIKRRVHFMNKWIKHGSYYPIWLLRIWRLEKGRIEERWMDEHIKLSEGICIKFSNDIVDHNLNNLTWWSAKHNNYATREAIDILNLIYNFKQYDDLTPKLFGSQEERKRWAKIKYSKLPLFIRPLIYFIYRFFFKLGFLDGIQGFIWHFLQGGWYRFLVDAKIYEIYRQTDGKKEKIRIYLSSEYNIKL